MPKYRILHEHITQDVYYVEAPDADTAVASLDSPDESIGLHSRIIRVDMISTFPSGVVYTESTGEASPETTRPRVVATLPRLRLSSILRCLHAHAVEGPKPTRVPGGTVGIITRHEEDYEVTWETGVRAWYSEPRLAGLTHAILTPGTDYELPA